MSGTRTSTIIQTAMKPRSTPWTWVRGLLTVIWLPTLLVLLWWIASAEGTSASFPPLSDIVVALDRMWFFEMFWTDFVPSALLVLQSLVLATMIGVVLGVLIGFNDTAERAMRPLLDFIRGIPKVLLISPALVILGVGTGLMMFVLTFGAIWPILLGTIDGIRGIPSQLHDLRRSYRLTRATWLFRIAVPAASPSIIAGIRTSLAIVIVLLVPAQAVGATDGLGFQLRMANDAFRFPDVWATAIMFALLGYALNVLLLGVIERRALSWFHARGGANS
ncbi:ABC transporter permease [Microbacterium karelineae]|uniref:ABC transporter permease n=1 Tax=Microbacterium karelineae TaxID=2654283 RepID=UPI0018D27AC3|nr:ABC transporter permease subunit [Microbacterium karelineae]